MNSINLKNFTSRQLKTIQPRILKGTRDFLPADMARRDYMMNTIRSVFERFGYDTIETPVIEYAETLLGKYGAEGTKLLYQFKDNGGRDIALRYDQTVPTARFVAMYANQLPMPFKRYQISRVWRADKPAKGRYREFYQCDVDIIGTDAILSEVEIAAVVSDVFTELGFTNYTIRCNSRRLINSILDTLGVAKIDQPRVIQLLDKLDKIGAAGVRAELVTVIDTAQADSVITMVTMSGSNAEKLEALQQYDVSALKQFFALCSAYGIPESALVFDVSLARGLEYYTGLIYEVMIPDLDLGSVCGGGRYENLCNMFTTQQFSGVGVAFGFDRILVAMEELGLLSDIGLNAQVLVTNYDEDRVGASISAVRDLQTAGMNTELYIESAKFAKQFKYANQKKIPFVVVIGPEEIERNEVTVKTMETGKQKTIPRNQLVTYFQGLRV